jgi:hypothetical protein
VASMDNIEESAAKLAINDLLTRFFQAFDDHDWQMMRGCLCDEVYTDYSSFRDVPAATIAGDRYVEQRRTALQALDMQHNFLNLRVDLDEENTSTAKARCNYIIHRFHPSFDGNNDHYFHSYGHYFFGLRKIGSGLETAEWRISSIVQNLLRNHGNREIHGATRTLDNTKHV